MKKRTKILIVKKNKALINWRKKSSPSMGEQRIINFFIKNRVTIYREWYDHRLFNGSTFSLLFFDFFIPKYKLVIEFDGVHHFKPIYGEEKLWKQRRRDRIKDKFCIKHKMTMLRIPYTEIDSIDRIICEAVDKIDPIGVFNDNN